MSSGTNAAAAGQVVISQAWTLDGDDHAAEYVRKAAAFDAYLSRQPGFRRRLLVQGSEDPTHFVHVREWDSIDDYQRMTTDPDYQLHIEDLSVHVDVARYVDGYPREFADVRVVTTPDA